MQNKKHPYIVEHPIRALLYDKGWTQICKIKKIVRVKEATVYSCFKSSMLFNDN